MTTPNQNEYRTKEQNEALDYVAALFLKTLQDSRKDAPEYFDAYDISIAVLAVHMLIERELVGVAGLHSYAERTEAAAGAIRCISLHECEDEADERVVAVDKLTTRH